MLILRLALCLAGYERKMEIQNKPNKSGGNAMPMGSLRFHISSPLAKQLENRRERCQVIDYGSHIRAFDMMGVYMYMVVSSLCVCV